MYKRGDLEVACDDSEELEFEAREEGMFATQRHVLTLVHRDLGMSPFQWPENSRTSRRSASEKPLSDT